MDTRNATVRARVNDALKHDVEGILSNLGLTMSDAINVMMNQIRLNKGLPFDVKIPNKMTAKTLDQSKKGEGITKFNSVDALLDDLTN